MSGLPRLSVSLLRDSTWTLLSRLCHFWRLKALFKSKLDSVSYILKKLNPQHSILVIQVELTFNRGTGTPLSTVVLWRALKWKNMVCPNQCLSRGCAPSRLGGSSLESQHLGSWAISLSLASATFWDPGLLGPYSKILSLNKDSDRKKLLRYVVFKTRTTTLCPLNCNIQGLYLVQTPVIPL